MTSFSQFLKQLPFLPHHFRHRKNPTEALKSAEPELQGITINVYELEGQDGSDNEDGEKYGSKGKSGYIPLEIDAKEANEADQVTSDESLDTKSTLHLLRHANVVVYCARCKDEVPVCTLVYHRKRHLALQVLRYSSQCPPVTVRGLLRRRNKVMEDLKKRSFVQEGQLIRSIHKINVAFELLKNEVQGGNDVDQLAPVGQWREKDIKAEGKILNDRLPLGVSKYKKLGSDSSNIKYVDKENFLESGNGAFLGIYQGYNGSYVTQLCVHDLHKDIQRNLRGVGDTGLSADYVKSVFQEAYQRIDRVQLIAEKESSWNRWSGCSAVTCLLAKDMLYTANEGNLQGLLIRENNTIRAVTSCHDLYNRKERRRVRKRQGLIVKTEKCALVNGVLETTRGLGNQGDWGLKLCVMNKPRVRVVSLKEQDKMLVLASEGVWKVFNHREIFFLLNKFIRDAQTTSSVSGTEESSATSTPGPMCFLAVPQATEASSKYESFPEQYDQGPIDFRMPKKVMWRPDNPQIVIRRATILVDEPLLEETVANAIPKKDFSQAEQNDEDLQELASIINTGWQSLFARREIARLLSKRLLKSALIAGAKVNNVVMVLLLKGFAIE